MPTNRGLIDGLRIELSDPKQLVKSLHAPFAPVAQAPSLLNNHLVVEMVKPGEVGLHSERDFKCGPVGLELQRGSPPVNRDVLAPDRGTTDSLGDAQSQGSGRVGVECVRRSAWVVLPVARRWALARPLRASLGCQCCQQEETGSDARAPLRTSPRPSAILPRLSPNAATVSTEKLRSPTGARPRPASGSRSTRARGSRGETTRAPGA